jgi:hypothetical protein
MDHEGYDTLDEPATEVERTGLQPVDRTRAAGPTRAGHVGRRIGLSVPGAVGGVLLIGAIAFGANLSLTASHDDDGAARSPDSQAAMQASDTPVAKDPTGSTDTPTMMKAPNVDGDATDEPPATKPTASPKAKIEPTAKPKAEATAKPKVESTAKPTTKPSDKPVMSLALSTGDGAVLVDWGGCKVDGAEYYKVVRSVDSTVRWPAGDGDSVVTAVAIGGKTKAWDHDAKPGKKVWYRVFCVRSSGDGYKVLAATSAKAIVAPAPKPKPSAKPEPSAMWLTAAPEGGAVVVQWEACGSDGFSHYRVLRKADGTTSVIAEINDAGTTSLVDTAVELGVTYHYAVQAKGSVDGTWTLLGASGWVGVAAE